MRTKWWTKYLIRKARVVVETMFVEHRPLKSDRAISHSQLKGRHVFTAHVHNNGRRPKKGGSLDQAFRSRT